ncbi:hypothetical protein HV819_02145 [Anaerococcus sp. AGMB00486]|nr:hypothetical protein [Anaerococcus faecalis]NVF10800.1 hypothetical protein [Anaerococcus faecalis]
MDYRGNFEKRKNRFRVDFVKAFLKGYGWSLEVREEIKQELGCKKDRLDMLRTGWSSSVPVHGGGSSQEDAICFILDEVGDLEDVMEEIKEVYRPIRLAIRSLDDCMLINIVLRLWVYKDESCRSLAKKYKVSKSAIWNKSNVALLCIWRFLVNYDED